MAKLLKGTYWDSLNIKVDQGKGEQGGGGKRGGGREWGLILKLVYVGSEIFS